MHYIRFSNGLRKKWNSDQVNKGMRLFDKEVQSLVNANVPKKVASSIEEVIAFSSPAGGKLLLPVGEMTEEHERHFEVTFEGEIPDVVVGIEFSRKKWAMEDGLMLWQSVIRKLANKILQAADK